VVDGAAPAAQAGLVEQVGLEPLVEPAGEVHPTVLVVEQEEEDQVARVAGAEKQAVEAMVDRAVTDATEVMSP
jgi:hypothetical protein